MNKYTPVYMTKADLRKEALKGTLLAAAIGLSLALLLVHQLSK